MWAHVQYRAGLDAGYSQPRPPHFPGALLRCVRVPSVPSCFLRQPKSSFFFFFWLPFLRLVVFPYCLGICFAFLCPASALSNMDFSRADSLSLVQLSSTVPALYPRENAVLLPFCNFMTFFLCKQSDSLC